jgi:hypothetical protein
MIEVRLPRVSHPGEYPRCTPAEIATWIQRIEDDPEGVDGEEYRVLYDLDDARAEVERLRRGLDEAEGALLACQNQSLTGIRECGACDRTVRVVQNFMGNPARIPGPAVALRAERDEALARCAMLREALDSVWAAIGDALCSGSGIDKTYAHGVQRDVRAALAATADAAAWLDAEREKVRAVAREVAFDAMVYGLPRVCDGHSAGECDDACAYRAIDAAIRARSERGEK